MQQPCRRFGACFSVQVADLQVVVPRTYAEFTTRRVLTCEWIEGEKLSQSRADDVASLVNVGLICYLKQLLETGLFHADPHPGLHPAAQPSAVRLDTAACVRTIAAQA